MLRADLDEFAGEVFASVPRRDQRAWGACYLRGLMLDGRRKSIQPMAARLPDGNMQALQQFVSQSPWDEVPVQQAITTRLWPQVAPAVLVVDDVSFPKCGQASVGVAPQYCGALGKQANCQVVVSVHAATDSASVPVAWRLFLPEGWSSDPGRCRAAGVPEEVIAAGHVEKWRLALDLLDGLAADGYDLPVVVADAGYGNAAEFRDGLAGRGLHYVVAVRGDIGARPGADVPVRPDYRGSGRPPQPRYRTPARNPVRLAADPAVVYRQVAWREGVRGTLASRFAVLQVRPSGRAVRELAIAAAGDAGWDGVLPALTLIVEWPADEPEPTGYWLTDLDPDTPIEVLVRLAKQRWRIEHDYRELKHGLGLDHFEGRSWRGLHHHLTLATAAHGFLTEQRTSPKARTPA